MSEERAKILRIYVLIAMVWGMLIPAVCTAEDLDIHNVTFMAGKYWYDGVLEAKPYGIWGGVSGKGITEVTMTAPGKPPIALEYWGGGGADWGFASEDYATLNELRVDFPIGNYVFTFNGGADSVILYHGPVEPTCFAKIRDPNATSTGVPLSPTIKWDSCVGCGDALVVLLWDEVDNTGIVTDFLDVNLTSWVPPERLKPSHLHELEVAVFAEAAQQPYNLTTDRGDDFEYYDLFEYCNTIQFTTVASAAPYYQTQIVPFLIPHATVPFTVCDVDFVFIKSTDDVNCWAGEDYDAVELVAINDNINSEGLLVPPGGFYGDQGVVLVYDVPDEAGNGSLCALSTAFDESKGGPCGSGLPTNLRNTTVQVDINFTVLGDPSILTLENALGFWLGEADGDSFETPGIFDLTKGWNTYTYELDDLANYPEGPGFVFGDSPVILLGVSFEDPDMPVELDHIVYFVDNLLIVDQEGQTKFFEDFEAGSPAPIE